MSLENILEYLLFKNCLIVGNHNSGKTYLLNKLFLKYIELINEKTIIFVIDSVTEHKEKSLIHMIEKYLKENNYPYLLLSSPIKLKKYELKRINLYDIAFYVELSHKNYEYRKKFREEIVKVLKIAMNYINKGNIIILLGDEIELNNTALNLLRHNNLYFYFTFHNLSEIPSNLLQKIDKTLIINANKIISVLILKRFNYFKIF